MAGTDDLEDVKAYISSSKYRLHVLQHLAEMGKATPKEIAESVNDPRPHVSRALSELRERDVVELLVPEARSVGRYYGITEKGTEAWPDIEERLQNIEWTIEEPTDPSMQSVVELAQAEFGEWLRVVGSYEGEKITLLYADREILSEYSDEEFEQGLRTVILDHSLDEFEMPSQECWSEVIHFDDFSVLKVLVDGDRRITISFANDHSVSVPEFSESIIAIFETRE